MEPTNVPVAIFLKATITWHIYLLNQYIDIKELIFLKLCSVKMLQKMLG